MLTNPQNVQFNPYNPKLQVKIADAMMYGSLAKYDQKNLEWIPHLATDWSVSDGKLTISLSDEFTWHNGDPVTAQDVKTKLLLERVVGGSILGSFNGVKTPDDTTIVLNLKGKTNKNLLFQNFLSLQIDAPHSLFKEYVQGVELGNPDAEYQDQLEKLLQYKVTEPVAWGPFEFDRRTGQSIELTKFEDHPVADKLNFSNISLQYVNSNQQRFQMALSGRMDGGPMIPTKSVAEQLPDSYVNYPFARGLGMVLAFNHGVKEFQDVRVRQALCHVFDRTAMIKNMSALGKEAMEFDTGFYGDEQVKREYLGDDLQNFTQYDDKEKAAQLLRDAGYTKESGTWMKPNGEKFSITLKAPSGFGSWRTSTNTATSQLQEFGIDASFKSETIATFLSQTLPSGNFEIAAAFNGNRILHPLPTLKSEFEGSPVLQPTYNYPAEFEVPMPVGNPDGSKETVNVNDLVDTASSTSGEEAVQALKKLSWTYNQTVPTYCAFSSQNYGYLNTANFEAPSEGPVTNVINPIAFMIHKGEVSAK
ncbi:ABC transporter substrate-binding protein [Halobaculum sp. P14]|uniref:ABC transporter substrate-binding protein n=1 Tax=Halobaculum sp. P14 TaxID=3421638 RepID=UPI003EBB3754